MKGVVLFSALCVMGLNLVTCYPYAQQPIVVPPHLLRQYLGQRQQEGARPEGAPIYEQDSQINAAPQYVQSQREQSQPQYVQQYTQPAQPQYIQQTQPQYIAQARPQQLKRPVSRPKLQQAQQALDEEDPADYDTSVSEESHEFTQKTLDFVIDPIFNNDIIILEDRKSPNPSYQFGFDVNDDQFTNYQNRKEERQGGVIKGSYSVVDSDGFIRTVTYTADPKEGFKAEVVRKPTDIVVKIPTPPPQTEQGRPIQYQLNDAPQQHRLQAHPRPQAQQQQQQPQQYYRYQ